MFFVKDEERTITLHPSFFGPNVKKYLEDRLKEDVEGKLLNDYFVVCVLDPHEFSEGKIQPATGFAEYRVHYRAIVWKPFKGEVVDAQVSQIQPNGFFVQIGPMQAFIGRAQIPSDIKYDAQATPPQWTDHADQIIDKGTQVRLRLKGIRGEMGSLFAIGGIREDYLGYLDPAESTGGRSAASA